MAYVSLSALKEFCNIPATETSNDALLGALRVAAQQEIEAYCRRAFEWEGAAVARYFHAVEAVSDRRLYLDRDCIAVTAVVNGDSSAISSTLYILEPRNYAADGVPIRSILLKADAGVSWTYETEPEGAISVTGKWAYSLSAPADIVQATKELAKFMLDKRRDEAGDLNRTVIAGNATVLPASWPRTVKDALDPYRKRRLAT